MRTINLQTVYQLVLTALLLGACLGLLSQRLPLLTGGSISAFEQRVLAAPAPAMRNAFTEVPSVASQNQDMTTKNSDASVQVEVEVHTRGNASAVARALGPGDTEVKTSTDGEGNGRSVAYIKAPESPGWLQPTPQPQLIPNLPASSTEPVLQPSVTVTEALVNLRSSPSLEGTVVGTAVRGQQFTIIGRDLTNSWWLVCCYQGQALWIHNAIVQAAGNTTPVTVVHQASASGVTNNQSLFIAPTPTLVPPMSTATPAPQYEFMLAEQEQFEERVTPRIFLYVHQSYEGLGGYTARVQKDGRELPVVQESVAGLPSLTWPLPNERQRSANLKLEFPHVSPVGVWEVQLLDASGRAVGPVATFRLQPDDANQEMYVAYRKV